MLLARARGGGSAPRQPAACIAMRGCGVPDRGPGTQVPRFSSGCARGGADVCVCRGAARRTLLPDFLSVAQAVRAVPDGSTVSVLDGDYVETVPIIITRRLTLQSSSHAAEATAARRLRFERGGETAEGQDRWAMEGAGHEVAAGLATAQAPGGGGLMAEDGTGVLLTGVPPTLGGVLAVGGGLGADLGAGVEEDGGAGDHADAPEEGGDPSTAAGPAATGAGEVVSAQGAGPHTPQHTQGSGASAQQPRSVTKSGWKKGMPKTPVTIRMFTQSESRKDPLLVVATRPPATVHVSGIAFMHLRADDAAGSTSGQAAGGTALELGPAQAQAAEGDGDGTAAAAAAAAAAVGGGGTVASGVADENEGATGNASDSAVERTADQEGTDSGAHGDGGTRQGMRQGAGEQEATPEDVRPGGTEEAVSGTDGREGGCPGSGNGARLPRSTCCLAPPPLSAAEGAENGAGDSKGRAPGTVAADKRALEVVQRSPAASPRDRGAQASRAKGLALGESLSSSADSGAVADEGDGAVAVAVVGEGIMGAGHWGEGEGIDGADGPGGAGAGLGDATAHAAGGNADVGAGVEDVDAGEVEALAGVEVRHEHGWRCVEVLRGVLHLSHCVVRSEEGNGLVARQSAAALVDMCHVSHCGLHGVSAVDGALVDAYLCKVASNALSGYNAVGKGACVRCRSCDVLDNEDGGVNVLQGALALTSASQLSANRGTGVRAVGEGSWAVQTDCTITNNGWHGVSALQGGSALVERSSLMRNMGAGVNAFNHGRASITNSHLRLNRFGVWSQNEARVIIDHSATGPSREGDETSLGGGVILRLPCPQDVVPSSLAAATAAASSSSHTAAANVSH